MCPVERATLSRNDHGANRHHCMTRALFCAYEAEFCGPSCPSRAIVDPSGLCVGSSARSVPSGQDCRDLSGVSVSSRQRILYGFLCHHNSLCLYKAELLTLCSFVHQVVDSQKGKHPTPLKITSGNPFEEISPTSELKRFGSSHQNCGLFAVRPRRRPCASLEARRRRVRLGPISIRAMSMSEAGAHKPMHQ